VFDLFVRILENSVIMSVAICVMYVLSRLTRNKTSPRVRHICWVVIAVGLLLPVRPSLITVPLPESVAQAVQGVAERAEQMPEVIPPDETVISNPESYAHTYNEGITLPADNHFTVGEYERQRNGMQINWRLLLPAVWGAGVCIFLLVCIIRHMHFMKIIRCWAKPFPFVPKGKKDDLLNDVRRVLDLRRCPELLTCPLTATPIITGLLSPVIILPDTQESPERLRLILLHEMLHIKRRDIWKRVLSLLASAVHWFNPLVYLMSHGIQTEAELACDTDVLRYAGDDARAEYGLAVFTTERRKHTMQTVFASALSGEGKNLKRRLAEIIEKKHTRRGLAIACAAFMVGAVLMAGMLAYEGERLSDGEFIIFTEDISWRGDGVVWDPSVQHHAENPITLENGGSLVIYLPGGWISDSRHSRIVDAIRVFRSQNPDVEVTVERVGSLEDWWGAYVTRVSTELMAGMGPDIILTDFFDDIHKTMDSGLFMDLSPLWHRDPDFTAREQLNPAIMDAGVYRGRRYVIPLGFTLPIYLSERGALENVGFDFDADTDIISFLNAVNAAVPKAQENPRFRFPINELRSFEHERFPIPLVDFERGIVLPYEAEVRAFSEAYLPFLAWNLDYSEHFWQMSNADTLIHQGRVMFIDRSDLTFRMFFEVSRMHSRRREPYITALRNHRGELHATVTQGVAINAHSPNYENAWKFIRLLLTEDRQYGRVGGEADAGLNFGMPVNMAALNRQIGEVLEEDQYVGTTEGTQLIYALSMEQKQPVMDLIEGITSASLPNRILLHNFYNDSMQPFFSGQRSMNSSLNELRRRLQFYVSE